MTARFNIDLVHPGRVAKTWQEPFLGPQGRRHLALFVLAGIGVLLLVLVAGILPTYWRLAADLNAIPRLEKDLAATEADLGTLRTNLRALTSEAKRQVRWAELLATFSQQIPATLRLQVVEASRVAATAAPGQPPGPGESLLRVEAITPVRPGHPPLLEIAQFMAGIMRDPAVNKRFQLKNWEIKPPTGGGEGQGPQFLNIVITFSERPS